MKTTILDMRGNALDKSATVTQAPTAADALKALDAEVTQLNRFTPKPSSTPGLWCFIPIIIGTAEKECGRPREKAQDLCCADHWKLLPKKYRVALIEANKLRSQRERQFATIKAADAAVAFLTALPIQLPPRAKVVAEQKRILGPDGIVAPDKLVSSQSKLIIPGG